VIAIASARDPISMLYVFLSLVGFVLFMFIVVRFVIDWILRLVSHKTNNEVAVVTTLMTCVAAAWVYLI
jgi:Kef-type K+ transport system membrane component KefB